MRSKSDMRSIRRSGGVGLATEVTAACVGYARDELKVETIVADDGAGEHRFAAGAREERLGVRPRDNDAPTWRGRCFGDGGSHEHPTAMKLAILSDIHGNRWALEAVLDDLLRTLGRRDINLGDSLWGVLDPAGTARPPDVDGYAQRARQHRSGFAGAANAAGAVDRDPLPRRVDGRSPRLAGAARAAVRHRGRARVSRNAGRRFQDASSKTSPNRACARRSGAEVGAVLGQLPPNVSIVLCGHSHVPGIVQVPGGPLVVNPGSIGLPAYRHHVPHPHRMESGSPHARYAVIQRHGGSWRVEFRTRSCTTGRRRPPGADEIGRADWAHALRTGHAMPVDRLESEVEVRTDGVRGRVSPADSEKEHQTVSAWRNCGARLATTWRRRIPRVRRRRSEGPDGDVVSARARSGRRDRDLCRIAYKSRAHRDAVNKRVMKDPRIAKMTQEYAARETNGVRRLPERSWPVRTVGAVR